MSASCGRRPGLVPMPWSPGAPGAERSAIMRQWTLSIAYSTIWLELGSGRHSIRIARPIPLSTVRMRRRSGWRTWPIIFELGRTRGSCWSGRQPGTPAADSLGSPSRPNGRSRRSAGRASIGAATSSTRRRSSTASSTSWVSRTRPSYGTSARRIPRDRLRCRTGPRQGTSSRPAGRSLSASCRSFGRPWSSPWVSMLPVPYRASPLFATRRTAVRRPFGQGSRPSHQPRPDLVVDDVRRDNRASNLTNLCAPGARGSSPRSVLHVPPEAVNAPAADDAMAPGRRGSDQEPPNIVGRDLRSFASPEPTQTAAIWSSYRGCTEGNSVQDWSHGGKLAHVRPVPRGLRPGARPGRVGGRRLGWTQRL